MEEQTSKDLLKLIEEVSSSTEVICGKIRTLEGQSLASKSKIKNQPVVLTNNNSKKTEVVDVSDPIEDIEIYLDDYLKFDGTTIEELSLILPSKDEYNYTDIIIRLQAESLKVIKEITEYAFEDSTIEKDASEIIARERYKIELLQQLLNLEEDIFESEPEFNKIVLVPNRNGNIKIFDELKYVPAEYYEEVYTLLGSIIDGTFKRRKTLTTGTNDNLISGVGEVRGSKIRILFRRLNYDTYAVFSVFMKKSDNSKALHIKYNSSMGEFKNVEDILRQKINDPEFMELNEQLLLELWRKLGYGDAPKTFRKDNV